MPQRPDNAGAVAWLNAGMRGWRRSTDRTGLQANSLQKLPDLVKTLTEKVEGRDIWFRGVYPVFGRAIVRADVRR
jgi:hypothetical protein